MAFVNEADDGVPNFRLPTPAEAQDNGTALLRLLRNSLTALLSDALTDLAHTAGCPGLYALTNVLQDNGFHVRPDVVDRGTQSSRHRGHVSRQVAALDHLCSGCCRAR